MNYGVEINQRNHAVTNSSSSSICSNINENIYNELYHNNLHGELTDLVFPDSLSDNQIQLIRLHLERLPENLSPPPKPWDSWSQLLLDELEGRIQVGVENKNSPVWNPVSLFSTYCRRLVENGIGLKGEEQFQLEFAFDVHESRIAAIKHKLALEQAEKHHQKQLIERLRTFS